MKNVFGLVIVVCALGMVTGGCGGSGGDPTTGQTIDSMQGEWYGAFRPNSGGAPGTMQFSVDAAGSITAVRFLGVVTGETGSLALLRDGVLTITLSGGRTGGFYTNPTVTHATVVLSDDIWGVVQKGATSMGPLFDDSDFFSHVWSGPIQRQTAAHAPATSSTGSMTVTADGSFATAHIAGIAIYNSAGERMGIANTQYGLWWGGFIDTQQAEGPVFLLMSPDRMYVGGSFIYDTGNWPQDAYLAVWTRE